MNEEQKIPKKFTKIIAPFSTLALSSSYCDSKVPRAHKVPHTDLRLTSMDGSQTMEQFPVLGVSVPQQ